MPEVSGKTTAEPILSAETLADDLRHFLVASEVTAAVQARGTYGAGLSATPPVPSDYWGSWSF